MDISQPPAPGDRIAACFGIDHPKTMITTPLDRATLVILHLTCCIEETGRAVVLPPDDAFLVILYLIDVHHCDTWGDRPAAPVRRYRKGSICLISLRAGAAICIRSDFDALVFHVPAALFQEFTDKAGQPPVDTLVTCRGTEDPVLSHLGAALLPMFDLPDAARTPVLDHMGLALNAHLAHRYGCLPPGRLDETGALTVSQERRSRNFMIANAGRALVLSDIAASCGLSPDRFASGFRQSTGQAPLDWLLDHRISRAETLLTETGTTLAEVARACGFAGEDNFVTAFQGRTGLPPEAWRSRSRH